MNCARGELVVEEALADAVRSGHVAGAQFHPERSAAVGARLLQNFIE